MFPAPSGRAFFLVPQRVFYSDQHFPDLLYSSAKLSPEPGLSFYSLWAAPWPLAVLRSQMPPSRRHTQPQVSYSREGKKRDGGGGPRVPVPNTPVAFASLSLLRVIPKFFLTAVSSAPFAPGLIDVWWKWMETDSHPPLPRVRHFCLCLLYVSHIKYASVITCY